MIEGFVLGEWPSYGVGEISESVLVKPSTIENDAEVADDKLI